VMFSLGGMVLIGGTVGVIVGALAQSRWGLNTPLQPAPGEVQFRMRLFGFAVPIFLFVLAGVLIGTWSMGQNYARRLISKQLAGTTGVAAESLGVFLDMGDDLMLELATEPQLISATPDQAITLLDQTYGTSSFFDGLALFDVEGYLIAGAPQDTASETLLPLDMAEPIAFLSDQENAHAFLATDEGDQQVNRVIFAIGVGDQTGEIQRTLWGQTIIDQNRIAQPFIIAMNALVEQGSEAFVVSNDGALLYPHPGEENLAMLNLANSSTATYFQSTSTEGKFTTFLILYIGSQLLLGV